MKTRRKTITRIFSVLMAVMVAVGFSVTMTEEVSAAPKTPAKVKIVSAKSDYKNGGVIVKWKKAKNAKKYEIYFDAKKNGKYEHYTISDKYNTSATVSISSLKPGQKYYFKVRAVNGSKKGKFSAVKSAKAVTRTPYIYDDYGLRLQSENSVAIDFSAYSYNSDYSYGVQIYRATGKNGKYKKIKTIKRGKNGVKSPYVDKKLSANTYSYKIRAYHKVGKKTVYSKFCKAQSIVVPKKVTITMDNWQNYFEIGEKTEVRTDAFGTPTSVYYSQVIRLKDKYKVQPSFYAGGANAKEYADTEIAYDVAYMVDIRSANMDKATGKLTIGSVIPQTLEEGETPEYPYTSSRTGTISEFYDGTETTVESTIRSYLFYPEDTSIEVGRDFKMQRIQGTLYLKKW